MNWFKRLCLFVFGVAGILALAGLLAPWWGPYTQEATGLMEASQTYWTAIQAVSAITAVGCAICLLRALLSPRNHKYITITREGGDEITVTRTAIASQAQHIVERDGSCVAGTVRVYAHKRGHIRVFVRVTPKHTLNVVEKGEELQRELDEGLAKIAADKIKSVNLQFTEPQEAEEDESLESTYGDVSYSVPASEPATAFAESAPAPLSEPEVETGNDKADNDITVSMSSFHRTDAEEPSGDTPLIAPGSSKEPEGAPDAVEPAGGTAQTDGEE